MPAHTTAERRAVFAFLAPAVGVYALFVLLPIVQSVYFSFFRWRGVGAAKDFVGLANFAELIGDAVFWRALGHNGILILLSLAIQLPLALLLALLLSGRVRLRGLVRTVWFAPMVMPTVAIAILWGFIYNPQFGILNEALRRIGLGALAHGWLGDPGTSLLAVVVTICWRYTGFHMVIFMAGLESIPEEIYEAARVDGATGVRVLRHITLPLLRRTAAISATLSIIGSLKYFDLVYLMTRGGPMHSSELATTYTFSAFRQDRYGYASALAVAMLLVAAAVSFAVLKLFARRREQA